MIIKYRESLLIATLFIANFAHREYFEGFVLLMLAASYNYRESLLIATLFIADLLIADFFQVSSPSLSRYNFVHRGFYSQSSKPKFINFCEKFN